MAQRSLTEIYDGIIAEKESLSSLDELLENSGSSSIEPYQRLIDDANSSSKVAKWRLFYWIIAFATWLHESLWYRFKTEVETIASSAIPGTLNWYQKISLDFQYGDNLELVNNKFVYTIIDSTKKVVKRAAAVESGGILFLKTAKLDGSDLPIPLSSDEFDAYKSYIALMKYAGTRVQFINENADLLKVSYDIYYNPLVIASDGSLISDPSVFPVEDAINNYLKNLPFNGLLRLSSFEDAIQSTVGIADFDRISVEAKISGGTYASVDFSYLTNAGHIKIDPDYPLSSQLNYIANV